jgi:hypothetical protein
VYSSWTKVVSGRGPALPGWHARDDLDLQQIRERKVREHDEFVASEINRAEQAVEEDAAALHDAAPPPRVPGGAIEH